MGIEFPVTQMCFWRSPMPNTAAGLRRKLQGSAPYNFWVYGKPVAWARARTSGGRYFTAPEQAEDVAAVRAAFSQDISRPRLDADAAWGLRVEVYLEPAPSWSRLRRLLALTGKLRPVSKPDWDNYGKQVSDALEGLCWANDSQVVEGTVIKHYTAGPFKRLITVWKVK